MLDRRISFCGQWEPSLASHLLRRTTLGPTYTEVDKAFQGGLAGTVARLLEPIPPPPPPLLHVQETESDVQVGETWIDRPHPDSGGAFRGVSLKGWFFNWLTSSPCSLQPQMVIFWLEHFGIAELRDHRAMYRFIKFLQRDGLSNVKAIMRQVTVEPAMLEFLDGESNDARNPNENYARELFELFTIQKGAQVTTGDYSHYTEDDVLALSRCLTGWTNLPFQFADDDTPVDSVFNPDNHDYEEKQLSHHFDNATIAGSGADEYERVIDAVFDQRETSAAFCRELYRYFVYYEISPRVEATVIRTMTDIMIREDFEIKPVLEALLTSAHFFDGAVTGAKIKNPIDFVVGMLRPFREFEHVDFPSLRLRYSASIRQSNFCADLDMKFNDLPTVSGLPAYYQAPAYYRNWASPASLQYRKRTIDMMISGLYHADNFRTTIDWRTFLAELPDAGDVNALIQDAVLLFMPRALTDQQQADLKENLLPGGLPDAEWTMEYATYISHPDDTGIASGFERQLYNLFNAMFSMLEFQLQ